MTTARLAKPILIRRVVSSGMAPKLRPGQLVLATRFFRKLHPGQVVIITHDDKELIKRIEEVKDDQVFVVGDNLEASTDSRQFSWLSREAVIGRVFWPNLAK